jgi:hypothetical protein
MRIVLGSPMDVYISELEASGMSLIIHKEGRVVFRSSSKGLLPHLEAIRGLGREALRGTVVADKIVGRAAALLMLYSLPSEVHAGVITVGGRRLLEEGGVMVFYADEVEAVKVKDGMIYCPFESMVQGISDPEEAYKAIEARMGRL